LGYFSAALFWTYLYNSYVDHTRGTVPSTCPIYGVQYLAFPMRLLLLSSDVELNPDPTEDTEMIRKALSDI